MAIPRKSLGTLSNDRFLSVKVRQALCMAHGDLQKTSPADALVAPYAHFSFAFQC
ncbi:hypothetical protein Q31b_01150 [Novipirellula aureliae]|uniref:Uncharacterized protein n=1 Tax=Novipirellula aureliae TaxID=2527966 RepID=A0A5C6E8Q3_9BACT|nr:hypothetical protein [Novipirellula aureliae]TWU44944.1 hypothetical protein Q31b_01150 [Novipirellula aureliae]